MKRALAILGLVVLGLGGLWLAWYARHRAVTPLGSPEPRPAQVVLPAPYVAATPGQLSPDDRVWERIHPVSVPLTYQVLMLPWGKSGKGPVEARAFHDGQNFYVRLEWDDATEDRGGPRVEDLVDATALMFPLQANQPPSMMMGFLGRVNIWHWKANWDQEVWARAAEFPAHADFYPFEDDPTSYPARAVGNLRAQVGRTTAVEDILSEGPGSLTPREKQVVSGRGVWRQGRWRVVMARSLVTREALDFQFQSDQKTRMAFAVWDGSRGEKGSRKSISEWVWLELERPPSATAKSTAQRETR